MYDIRVENFRIVVIPEPFRFIVVRLLPGMRRLRLFHRLWLPSSSVNINHRPDNLTSVPQLLTEWTLYCYYILIQHAPMSISFSFSPTLPPHASSTKRVFGYRFSPNYHLHHRDYYDGSRTRYSGEIERDRQTDSDRDR